MRKVKVAGRTIEEERSIEVDSLLVIEDDMGEGYEKGEGRSFGGLLITYHRGSDSMDDRGLRFEKINQDVFRCPVCNTDLKPIIL